MKYCNSGTIGSISQNLEEIDKAAKAIVYRLNFEILILFDEKIISK